MDEFLKPGAAHNRLWAEYQKYENLIVACDFDSTLFDFHGTGESYELVRQLVRDLYAINCHIIIWTANPDIEFIKTFLAENDIPYHSINEDSPASLKFTKGNEVRKIYANSYIDDRAGLSEVYNDLTRLVRQVRTKTFYRVANENTGQGLWYNGLGHFTGLIHNEFNFCKNSELKMDFDEELVGWLSAADSLEGLYHWFSKEDILELQKHGWYIVKYKTDEYKFYDRFQHYIIKQGKINFVEKIILDETV